MSIGTPAINGKHWKNEIDKKLSLGERGQIQFLHLFVQFIFFLVVFFFICRTILHHILCVVIHDSHFVLLRDGVYAACRFC